MNPSQEVVDQAPPHSEDAEKMVAGACVVAPSVFDEIGWLSPSDFYKSDLRAIFQATQSLYHDGQPVTGATILAKLPGDQWAARIAEVAATIPSAAHAALYARPAAQTIAKAAKFRRIREIAEDTLPKAQRSEGEPAELLDALETELASITLSTTDGEPIALADAAAKAITHIDEIQRRGQSAGVPTGLSSFDQDMGGLFPGELCILAARPGCGKTSLALQIAQHNAERGSLVYFVSLEMSAIELSVRMACGESGVSNRLVRIGQISGENAHALNAAFCKQASAALEIHDRASLTVASIRREIRKRKKRGLTLAVIDYLQLIQPEDRRLPREQQVARMVRQLKETAREYEIPILCLCQLNRQADADDTPRLSQLRESGAIEQDADVVLFLGQHEPKNDETHNAILTVAKNRNGETGPLRLDWDASRTRFSVPGHNEFSEYAGGEQW